MNYLLIKEEINLTSRKKKKRIGNQDPGLCSQSQKTGCAYTGPQSATYLEPTSNFPKDIFNRYLGVFKMDFAS